MKIIILNDFCGAKRSGDPDPFHIKPKTYVEEEEMPKDEPKGTQTTRMYYRGRPYPRQTKITEGEIATPLEAFPSSIPKEVPSPVGQP